MNFKLELPQPHTRKIYEILLDDSLTSYQESNFIKFCCWMIL